MAYCDLTLELRGRECLVQVSGTVTHGGSASHGSDEPPWSAVENLEFWNLNQGRPVRRSTAIALLAEHGDYIEDSIIEAYAMA